MNEKFITNNLEKDHYSSNNKESDYKSLITNLKEISKNIALLEKTLFS